MRTWPSRKEGCVGPLSSQPPHSGVGIRSENNVKAVEYTNERRAVEMHLPDD